MIENEVTKNLKNIIKYLVALLVIGGISEFLYNNVSPLAGYGLVYIIILAYAITGDNLQTMTDFLASIGLVTK